MGTIRELISKVVERIDLEEEEMERAMSEVMEGSASPSQIAAFLVGLRMKGETVSEITGAARLMRRKCTKIVPRDEATVDLCGTGGDNQGTFNISTVASLIAAGAGVSVAKHGNRGVSSGVGSADVLAELGVNIDLLPENAEKCLNEIGINFLYAPNYHPAMKSVSGPRRDLGIRTIFNVLGPIANPAGVTHQVMGVFSEVLLEPIARVLRNLGSLRCMVVHGSDGMDEITVTGKTYVAELRDGMVKTYQLDPADYGFKRRTLKELRGGTAKVNSEIVLSILKGEEKDAKREISVLNAAAAIYVAGMTGDMKSAIEMAEESIDLKRALYKLNDLIKFSAGFN